MRLINTETLNIHEFIDVEFAPKYAILSHCWGHAELSFQDYAEREIRDGQGYAKIRNFCTFVKDIIGLEWAWIDTCCIDKRSSAELSEAINSMFRWYRDAEVCIIYLHDLTADLEEKDKFKAELCNCKWFTRGWTLQELIAPRSIMVLDANWHAIGPTLGPYEDDLEFETVCTSEVEEDPGWFAETIAGIAGIPVGYVTHSPLVLTDHTVAQRLSWMSTRWTTRPEDMGYCLLGLLDLNMPLLYGEGFSAFSRLQLEVLNQRGDESVFAWGMYSVDDEDGTNGMQCIDMFAMDPTPFESSQSVVVASVHDRPPLTIRSHYAELRPASRYAGVYFHRVDTTLFLVRLNCAQRTSKRRLSPCIIFLRFLGCGHLIRVPVPRKSVVAYIASSFSDVLTCCEEDLSDVDEWEPLATDETLLVHLTTYAQSICAIPNADSMDPRSQRKEGIRFRLQAKDGQSRRLSNQAQS